MGDLRIEALRPELREQFLDYCRKYRGEIDDSFLYEEDLREFLPGPDNPTYVALDRDGRVAGAVSLILDELRRRSGKARFRILHAETEDPGVYKSLLEAAASQARGMKEWFAFVPGTNRGLAGVMEKLSFYVERYSSLLVRDCSCTPATELPGGYRLRPFRPESDAEAWCVVRNRGFANLMGSDTPVTPEMVLQMAAGERSLEDGMIILCDGERPVGVVRGSDDEYEGRPIMNIGPLALLPEYQGRGLGRTLLRAALELARSRGYAKAILCVNGENERAKALYLSEGFELAESAVCYTSPITGGRQA